MSFDELLARQYGIASADQLLSVGMTRGSIRWAVENGKLHRLFGTIYRAAGAPLKWEQRALGATLLLGPGSALSHQTAGLLWGVAGLKHRTPIHVLVPRRTNVVLPEDVVLHHTRRQFVADRRHTLPVTALARTVLDIAESLDDLGLEIALDSAQHRRPFLEHELDRELATIHRQSTPGARRVAELLDLRGGVATESPLETRVRRTLRSSGLPAPALQFELFDDGRRIVRLDFAWPAHRVALHADGYTWHGRRRQFELDARQRSAMAALDWHSLVVTDDSLRSNAWLRDLSATLAHRTPQLTLPWRQSSPT